ncbi:MAG: hypothetical protein FIA89_12745 [Geobacter sp.]|jgi:hypothetical protein|nr:hypothetical protein [Geobacter sp.]
MQKDMSFGFSIFAFAMYIIGGLTIFSGIFMVLVLKNLDIFGLGTAETLGYLFLCVGACLCIAGVLTLRIIRNRTNHQLYQKATGSK